MDQEESPFLVSEDSKDEFIIDTESDSDFGLVPRKQPHSSQLCRGRLGACISCILIIIIAGLAGVFALGILIGHFGINDHLQSEGTSPPPPTSATPPPCVTSPSIADEICSNPPLLLVSLDGFRASYFERNQTPFLETLAAEGVRAEYMKSVFLTLTFPNHYSIVTGLYPESHGIVNNAFYDTVLKDKFYIGSSHMDQTKWWKGEPIWVTARKAGLVTGVYFWPGSEVEIQGFRPNYYFNYNSEISFEERVDTVLSWLDFPSKVRPQFLAMYLEEPDHSGHQDGPYSTAVDEALARVDQAINRLYTGLEERQIRDCVNVMIISDHGMALNNESKLVDLSNYVPKSVADSVEIPAHGPVAYIESTGGSEVVQAVFDSLVTNATEEPVRFYPTSLLPFRLHAGHQHKERYGDLQLLVDIGGYMAKSVNSGYQSTKGHHGYDNIFEEVHAIFLAHGPAFQKGLTAEAFDNIQLYNLMCGLLGLTPAPNNGSVGSLYHLLQPSLLSKLPQAQSFPAQGGDSLPDRCPFPADESELLARSLCGECVCREGEELGCEGVSNDTILEANRALDISDNTAEMYTSTHLPWGIPTLVGLSPDACLLAQQHYVSLYSTQFHLPLWTAYKLTREQVEDTSVQSSCFRRDPRLLSNSSAQCSNYSPRPSFTVNVSDITYTQSTLVPVSLAQGLSTVEMEDLASSLLSNVVPQDYWFNQNVWQPLQSLISDWAVQYGSVHVITGPVLDSDHDGVRDDHYTWWSDSLAVPTGYYVLVVRCLDEGSMLSMCGYDQLDVIGFLLQHPTAPGDRSSANRADILRLSLTQVRDIERITGLNFFSSLTPQEQNKIELRIFNNLWP